MRDAAGLRPPCITAVVGVQDRPAVTDHPTRASIGREGDAEETSGRGTWLRLPGVAAVTGGENGAVWIERPASPPIGGEVSTAQTTADAEHTILLQSEWQIRWNSAERSAYNANEAK